MNWIKNIWSQVWKTGNNDFASGAYSELATPKLLSSAKRKVVIEDLICEIEERNLPPTDKAMELFLKSYEIWNIGGVENIEIAMVGMA